MAGEEFVMSSKHKEALRRNHVRLVDDLIVDGMLDYLYQNGLLTKRMKLELEEEKKTKQAGKLLDILPKRGPTAMKVFVDALMVTDQHHLAGMLDADLSSQSRGSTSRFQHPSDEGGPQHNRPHYDAHSGTGTQPQTEAVAYGCVKQADPHRAAELINSTEEPVVYKMYRKARGFALVINNMEFKDNTTYPTRAGSEKDVEAVTELFSSLDFTVITHTNLDSWDMEKAIDNISQRPELTQQDALVVVLMSHGRQNHVLGTDGRSVGIEAIKTKLDLVHCPHMGGKPKFIIIQACQGDGHTMGQMVARDGGNTTQEGPNAASEDSIINIHGRVASDATPGEPMQEDIHEKCDFIVAVSTVKGYESYRHTINGTWFIQNLVSTFKEKSHEMHVLDMMTMVNNKVGKESTAQDRLKQISTLETMTLRKSFYFFPGYFGAGMRGQQASC